MNFILNPKVGLIIIFFSLLRFIDANPSFKGVIFIFSSLIIIYLGQKNYSKKFFIYLFCILVIFFFSNEKRKIEELSFPLKLSESNEIFYLSLLGNEKFSWIKNHYINLIPECYLDKNSCFRYSKIANYTISPDQLIFDIDFSVSRKVNEVNFTSLANSRLSLINPPTSDIDPKKIHKLDTPFFVQYSSLEDISEICFKGLAFIQNSDGKSKSFNHIENKCVEGKFNSFSGINLPNNNLELNLKSNKFTKFNDDIILLLFLLFLILNVDKKFFSRDIKLFLPTLSSVLIIFYISRYDNWFNVFNLFNFYFFGFEGGDASTYINFTSDIFQSFLNGNLVDFIRGGEDVFYFTPGLRYFLFLNQLISGDFYYLYFFMLFFLPRIIYNYFNTRFNNKIAYVVTISFLLIPFLHHLGFSYYQYIRHAYRLFPESLGYMFFILGLTIFLKNFKENYLQMNLLFAISVLLRPNLVVSIVLIVLTKTIIERINIFKFKYFIYLNLISLLYLFPLLHNYYFGNSLTLFTGYGSRILSLENILSKDIEFYIERIVSINLPFLILIFIPKLNYYLKIILITQFLTVFWFDMNERYYWMYWFISLTMILDILVKYKFKWKLLKKFT